MALIHSKAHVDDSAIVGAGTRVWQFASVIRGARIGAECSVAACAIVDGAIMGDRCAIGHGAQLHPGTKVGSDVFIGPAVVVCNDMWPAVDKRGFDMHGLKAGDRHTVVIEDGVSLGAGCVVLPGVRVGEGAVIAAGAVVDRNVPALMVWRRNGYAGMRPDDWRERRMRWAK